MSKPELSASSPSSPELLASNALQQKPFNEKGIFMVVVGIVLTILVLGGIGVFIFLSNKDNSVSVTDSLNKAATTPAPSSFDLTSAPKLDGDFSVVVKENPNDKLRSDIYLKNKKTQEEVFFISLSEVYRNHYHNAEFHNGNLYIVTRTGGESGYQNNPNWTDMLWRYNQLKQGQKLYSVQGLDFRVSDDEKYLAIITNEKFSLLDKNGNAIKTFIEQEVKVLPNESPGFGFLAWGNGVIWLDNAYGPSLTGVVKINVSTYEITKYDLSKLPAGPEYSLNPDRELIAFSNYPALFDVDGAIDYEQSGSKVNLVVYDLKTKSSQQIATSITKRFYPAWIDENTLEYDSPNGEGRLTKKIP